MANLPNSAVYQLVFYAPQTHVEQVKAAIFQAGAGSYKGYAKCSWQTTGVGQFLPLEGSSPFLGQAGQVERVPEVRVEAICRRTQLAAALRALVESHPYEQPAYHVYPVYTLADLQD